MRLIDGHITRCQSVKAHTRCIRHPHELLVKQIATVFLCSSVGIYSVKWRYSRAGLV